LNQLGDGGEGRQRAGGPAGEEEHVAALRADPGGELGAEPRLADAGVADQTADELHVALDGGAPALAQAAELADAAVEARRRRRPAGPGAEESGDAHAPAATLERRLLAEGERRRRLAPGHAAEARLLGAGRAREELRLLEPLAEDDVAGGAAPAHHRLAHAGA